MFLPGHGLYYRGITIVLMKIEFDSTDDKELFKVLLDSFISMSGGLEDEEMVFINKVYATLDTP